MTNASDPGSVSAVRDDALGDDDTVGLLRRLERREVSAEELRAAALERAATVNPQLNALTLTLVEPPRTEVARREDAPFTGIPTVIKDNEDLTGSPTLQGSWAMPDTPATRCSPWVAQFLAMGVSPIGKSTLPEFGLTASTESPRFGATRNPWDLGRSVGGSSGGSAALVAAGVVPMAHANDGGGSIRIPAACCGLVGLKPTRGRILDRPEVQQLPVRISAQGVLTRTVRDTARYLAEAERANRVLLGGAHRPPGLRADLPEIGHVEGPSRRRLRVGVVLSGFRGMPIGPETLDAVRAAGERCEQLGHHVEEIHVPVEEHFGPDFLTYWAFLAFLLRFGGRSLYGPGFDGSRTDSVTQGLAAMFARHAPFLPAALRRLRRVHLHEAQVFEGHDVVLSPVLGHEAPPIGFLGPDVPFRTHLPRLLRFCAFTPVQNVTGAPGISLPMSHSSNGMPIGVHATAPAGHERRLLELAYELEEAAPWPLTPASASV